MDNSHLRILASVGLAVGGVFGIVALRIFGGVQIVPTASSLLFYVYSLFVPTFIGWIWTPLTTEIPSRTGSCQHFRGQNSSRGTRRGSG